MFLPFLPHPAARFAAGFLLSCVLAPAHGGQPSPRHSHYRCEIAGREVVSATPCKTVKQAGEDARRQRPEAARRECSQLQTAIHESEQAEHRARSAMIESVQQDLWSLRQRYKKLGC